MMQFYQTNFYEDNYNFIRDCKKYLEAFVQNQFFDIALKPEIVHNVKIDLSKFIQLSKSLQNYQTLDQITKTMDANNIRNNKLEFVSVNAQLYPPKQQGNIVFTKQGQSAAPNLRNY